MKKTFTILMAMAGVAMGADYPIVIDNSQGTATETTALDNSKHQSTEIDGDTTVDLLTATVAVTLNISNVLDVNGHTPIFTIQGINARNAEATVKCGVGVEYASTGKYLDTWYGSQPDWNTQSLSLSGTEIGTASCGVVVFTIKQNMNTLSSELSELLFLYDQNGNLINNMPYVPTTNNQGKKMTYFGDFANINITKDLVYAAEVYGTVFEGEQVYNLAESMMKGYLGESIPEPTTTTLSLLALAGLAARRRRK